MPVKKTKLSKSDAAHFDAIPILLEPLIKCKGTGKPISQIEAIDVLQKWDKARCQ